MRLTQRLEGLRSDVRLALRQLSAAPGFTSMAALTLALGIGVNSAIFALADATLIRPLPFGRAGRLVMLWENTPGSPKAGVSPLNMRDWIVQSRSFEGIAYVQHGMGGGPLVTAPDGSIETAERQSTSANFFDVLEVVPIVGRTFKPEDDGPSPRVVLLGEAVWRRRFGADPSIVGRAVRLNGQPYTVVGVVADNVQFSRPAEIWTLSPPFPDIPILRAARAFDVVARLKPDVTIESARAELGVIAERLAREYPEPNQGTSVSVEPVRAGIVGSDLRTTSIFLLGVVGCVLLLCCANVANLLLARVTARAREIAVRSALGAERGRIVRQLLTESLVLAVIGGALGIGVGAAILTAAPALIPAGLLPAAVTPGFDLRVVLFAVAAALVVGVAFGLVPAWQATGTSLVGVMASESRSATAAGSSRLRSLLVASEVAAAVLLLCGAGLLLQTVLTLVRGDTGYRSTSESVLSLDFSVRTGKSSRYPSEEAITQFYDAVGRDVASLPEVRSVGWASSLPYGPSELGRWAFEIVGDPPIAARDRPTAEYTTADPGYFRTLDLPVVSGRGFNDHDTLDSLPVCVVNEAFVRRHFKDRDPIGMRLSLMPPDGPAQVREVVGVARQTSGQPDAPEELLQVYAPLAQFPTGDVFMVVQPAIGTASALTPLVRRVVARIDPEVPVRRDRTLEALAIESTAGYRFRAKMVGTFAALALVLAMVGVFGVLACTVQQRQREIGVRMALGATSTRVMWLVFRDAGRMIATGAAVGMILAAFSGRLLAAFLFGVDPLDPLTFVSVPVVILFTAIVAAGAPAWRASRINPVEAFRHDG
jgi:putative ABC transport system permease protein